MQEIIHYHRYKHGHRMNVFIIRIHHPLAAETTLNNLVPNKIPHDQTDESVFETRSPRNPAMRTRHQGLSESKVSFHLSFLLTNNLFDNSHPSPRIVRVKEEDDHDMLEATPPPPPPQPRTLHPIPPVDVSNAPPPVSLSPPSKKRRVTISGGPHPLNTDVRVPSTDPANTTPISPAVMGFTIGRDDPAAIEQVRSMLTVKQKQKALIEQRRGSVAGIVSIQAPPVLSGALSNEHRRGSVAGILTVPSSGKSPRAISTTRLSAGAMASSPEEHPMISKPPLSARTVRRSPNAGISSNSRRGTNPPNSTIVTPAPPFSTATTTNPPPPQSPSSMIVPSQQKSIISVQQTSRPSIQENHNLPPPPISFARRRADHLGGGKNKPADLMISPRDQQFSSQLAPSIQSAPPVPHAQSMGKHPMTLPRLPTAMNDSQNVQRVTSGRVPPTPTRLTMQRGPSTAPGSGAPRSPAASVPIATTLVPPTPVSLDRPGDVGEKSAFLAPFEMFYDSLSDSKQLKNWLSDQLQKSNSIIASLKQQQENMEEMIERTVERKTSRMQNEISTLHTRVEELEGALRLARSEEAMRRPSVDMSNGAKALGKYVNRNGISPSSEPPAAYTFPPVEPARQPDYGRKVSSPGWGHSANRERSPSANMDIDRRPSISSGRYESGRPQPSEPAQSRTAQNSLRGLPPLPPLPPLIKSNSLKKSLSRSSQPDRSGLTRHHSLADIPDSTRGAKDNPTESGRRNSVIMSPPEDLRRPSGNVDG